MSLLVAAAVLVAITVTLLGPASTWLADASWVTRAPRSAVALWQAIGLSAIASGIGAGLAVAVYRYHAGFAPGVGELTEGLVGGHPLQGLGLPDALGLTLAADLLIVLFVLFGSLTTRTIRSRARHRRLLNLLARQSSEYPGTDLIDDARPVAYCLPGRPSQDRHQRRCTSPAERCSGTRGHRARTWPRARAPRAGDAADGGAAKTLRLGALCAAGTGRDRHVARDVSRRLLGEGQRSSQLGGSSRSDGDVRSCTRVRSGRGRRCDSKTGQPSPRRVPHFEEDSDGFGPACRSHRLGATCDDASHLSPNNQFGTAWVC